MSAQYTSPTTGFAVVEVIRHFERLGVFEALETPTTVSSSPSVWRSPCARAS